MDSVPGGVGGPPGRQGVPLEPIGRGDMDDKGYGNGHGCLSFYHCTSLRGGRQQEAQWGQHGR